MVMAGGYLPRAGDKDFFGIGLAAGPLRGIPVAEGKKEKPDPVIIAAAEIRQVPAQLVVPDLIVLRPLVPPVAGGLERERRQGKTRLHDKNLGLRDMAVYFRTLHRLLLMRPPL
jgi:hypothetical protein